MKSPLLAARRRILHFSVQGHSYFVLFLIFVFILFHARENYVTSTRATSASYCNDFRISSFTSVAQCFQIDENGKNSCLARELDISTSKLLEQLLIIILFEARYRLFPLKHVPIFTGALKLSSWNYRFSRKWDNSLWKPNLFTTVLYTFLLGFLHFLARFSTEM